MSCSSIKHRVEELKNQGGINFLEAVNIYNDLQGSLDAHQIELRELQKTGDDDHIFHLQQHISDGEQMLSKIKRMTVQ